MTATAKHPPSPQQAKRVGRYAIFSQRMRDYVRRPKGNASKTPGSAQAETQQTKEMSDVIDTAQEVLLEVTSIFPFMLFPDSLKVDRQKVILIYRNFFGVARIINIQIEDLQAIEVGVGPFFGSVSITTKQFSNTVNKIHMLSRNSAVHAQQLLEGFVIANQKKLDYSNIDKDTLVPMLKELGQGSGTE